MDIETIRDHLHQAERHVRQGNIHLLNQWTLIQDLAAHGHNTLDAERLYVTMQGMQELHEADLTRLQNELGACGKQGI
jgi:hypothetical protein